MKTIISTTYICLMFNRPTYWFFVVVIFITLRYTFIPIEFTGDSYGYSCEILDGELYSAHHLLHKPLFWGLFQFVSIFNKNINPILIFTSINLLFAILSLFVLKRILLNRNWNYAAINTATLFLMGTFVFLKYSFQVEAYTVPIFLSLLGSLYFEKQKFYTSSIWLGLACLFHQIHIFWLIGLWIVQLTKKQNIIPLVLGLCIPIFGYIATSIWLEIPLFDIIFQDVNAGLVTTSFSTKHIFFSGVNLFRTITQIHPDLLVYWGIWNPLLSGFGIVSILIILVGIVVYIKEKPFSLKKLPIKNTYLFTILLFVLFAVYSVGNIEFMVMLPFLIVLGMPAQKVVKGSSILVFGIICWNFSQFIYPESKHSIHRLSTVNNFISKNSNSDSIIIFGNDAHLYVNYCEYFAKINKENKIFIGSDSIIFEQNKHNSFQIQTNDKYISRSTWKKDSDINAEMKFVLNYSDSGKLGNLKIVKITN